MFWWVVLDLFSLEFNELSNSDFGHVYGFVVALGSLYFNAQGYVPAWYVFLWNFLALGWSLVSV